jgi:2-keto-3-deoxy-L-rhamnonate aldolase RhmA
MCALTLFRLKPERLIDRRGFVFKTNRIKDAMKAGRKAHGFRLTIPSAAVVEILGKLDFDYVYIDDEHGVFDNTVLEDVCRAAELVGMTPIARVPDLTGPTVNRRLDRGVRGIVGPHVSSPADAELLVQSCHFGPRGTRSLGGGRGVDYQMGIPDMPAYYRQANENMFVAIMIEDRAGMDSVEQIVAVDGVDAVFMGPNDFAQDLGFPGDTGAPEVRAAIADITARVHKVGGRMRDDVLVLGNLPEMLVSAGRKYARPKD